LAQKLEINTLKEQVNKLKSSNEGVNKRLFDLAKVPHLHNSASHTTMLLVRHKGARCRRTRSKIGERMCLLTLHTTSQTSCTSQKRRKIMAKMRDVMET
jgi:hypothetical protein